MTGHRFFRLSFILLGIFLFFSQAVFAQGANELLNQIKLQADISTDNPLTIFEDDYNKVKIDVVTPSVFTSKPAIDSSLSGQYRFSDVNAIVQTLTSPCPKICMFSEPDMNKFLKDAITISTDEKEDPPKSGNYVYDEDKWPLEIKNLDNPKKVVRGINIISADWGHFASTPDISGFKKATCFLDKRCLAGKDDSDATETPEGKCCWIKKHKETKDKDKDGNPLVPPVEEDVIDGPQHCKLLTSPDHESVDPLVVATFLKASLVGGSVTPIARHKSFTLNVKDRTPPMICDLDDKQSKTGHLPPLFEAGSDLAKKCTTGDNVKIKEIKLFDNSNGKVYSRMSIGSKSDPIKAEKWLWAHRDPFETQSGDIVPYIIVPNECKGKMNYTIMAWDSEKNLNPGIPEILDDKPDKCYGVPGGDNLFQGKDFPYKYLDDTDKMLDNMKNGFYSGTDKNGEITITDNDRPNLLIKIESIKDKHIESKWAMSFPPPSKNIYTDDLDYQTFVEGCISYEEHLGLTGGGKIPVIMAYLDPSISLTPPGLSIIDNPNETAKLLESFKKKEKIDINMINGRKYTTADEKKKKDKEKEDKEKEDKEKGGGGGGGTEPPEEEPQVVSADFVTLNFRMENYSTSDTDDDGVLIEDTSNFGERMGFGQEAMVISTKPLVEDVEYQVSVWAEDNIKWDSDLPGTVHASGIESCKIRLRVPNQSPPVSIDLDLPKTELGKFAHGPYRFICQEPTQSIDVTNLQTDNTALNTFCASNKNPFIEVEVKDSSFNRRALRVYFPVVDSSTKVRILEQKHTNN